MEQRYFIPTDPVTFFAQHPHPTRTLTEDDLVQGLRFDARCLSCGCDTPDTLTLEAGVRAAPGQSMRWQQPVPLCQRCSAARVTITTHGRALLALGAALGALMGTGAVSLAVRWGVHDDLSLLGVLIAVTLFTGALSWVALVGATRQWLWTRWRVAGQPLSAYQPVALWFFREPRLGDDVRILCLDISHSEEARRFGELNRHALTQHTWDTLVTRLIVIASMVIAAVTMLGGCQEQGAPDPLLTNFDDPTPPRQVPDPPAPPADLEPTPATDICEEGEIRCVPQGDAEIEVCGVPEGATTPVTRWIPSRCPQGEVCQRNECGPLACIPGQPVCADQAQIAACNEAGDGVVEPEPCPEGQICRNGACLDLCAAAARNRSYIGCNYLVVDLPNPFLNEGSENAPFGLVVANPDPVLSVRIAVENATGEQEAIIATTTVRPSELATNYASVEVSSSVRDRQGQVVSSPQDVAQGPIDIPPRGFATLLLPRRSLPMQRSGVFTEGRRLRANRPVVAYQYNPYCCNFSFTNDASLLLPVEALGTDYVMLGVSDWPKAEEFTTQYGAGLALMAGDEATEVTVEFDSSSVRLFPDPDGQLSIPEVSDEASTESVTHTIEPGEVLYLESFSNDAFDSEFTGAHVRADKPVAAFSSHPCTYVPAALPACDHLEEQLIPTDTWGDHYVLSPPVRRGESLSEVTYWRIVAGQQPVVVRFNQGFDALDLYQPYLGIIKDCRNLRDDRQDNTRFALEPYQDCMIGSRYGLQLQSEGGPVQVMGLISGEKASATRANPEGTGDPSMFLLPPVTQFRDNYHFLTPETYALDYVTLVVIEEALGGLTLDGLPLDPQAEGVTGQVVPGSRYVIVNVPVSDGAHLIEGTAPFGLLVYAYDRFVSYAYTGGLNLTKRR